MAGRKFTREFRLSAVQLVNQHGCSDPPEEELYDLRKDPWELDNVAGRRGRG
jgi:hypothetical protein